MNKTFKVVFNKARGALMVVNEATSSVQKKGTKTVIAAAVAAMVAGVAGTAMAETTTTTESESVVVKNDPESSKLPSFVFGEGKAVEVVSTNPGVVGTINTVINAINAQTDLTGKLLKGVLTAASQPGTHIGIGGGYFSYAAEEDISNLVTVVNNGYLAYPFTNVAENTELPFADTSVTIGDAPSSGTSSEPFVIGFAGADVVLAASPEASLTLDRTNTNTAKTNSTVTLKSGNTLAGGAGGVTVALGGNGTTLNNTSTLNVEGHANVGLASAAGVALSMSGEAVSNVADSVLNINTTHDANNAVSGVVVGVSAGGVALATEGTASANVGNSSTVNFTNGHGMIIAGGGIAGAIGTANADTVATAETKGSIAITVGNSDTQSLSVYGLIGGGIAASRQPNGAQTDVQTSAAAKTGKVTITLNNPVQPLTGAQKSEVIADFRDVYDTLSSGSADISALALDVADKLSNGGLSTNGVAVGVFGGGIAASYQSDAPNVVPAGEKAATATATTDSSEINIKNGYNVAVIGAGAALASGSGNTKATSTVGSTTVNVTGGETIGIVGGGVTYFTGTQETHAGVAAEASVGESKIAVTGGSVDGIIGGGIAWDDSNASKTNVLSKTDKVSVTVGETGKIFNVNVDAIGFQDITNVSALPGFREVAKETFFTAQEKKIAILGGGVAAGATLEDVAGSQVGTVSIDIQKGGQVTGNIFGGGLANTGAISTVDKVNISVASGSTVNGDIYAGGIARDNAAFINEGTCNGCYINSKSEVTSASVAVASGTVKGTVHTGGATLVTGTLPETASTMSTVESATVTLTGAGNYEGTSFVNDGVKKDGTATDAVIVLDGVNSELKASMSGFQTLSMANGTATLAKLDGAVTKLTGTASTVLTVKELGNTLTIDSGKVVAPKITGKITLAGGTLETGTSQIFTIADQKVLIDKDVTKVTAKPADTKLVSGMSMQAGSLLITDEGVYTSDSLAAMSNSLGATSKTQLNFVTAKLAEGENGALINNIIQSNDKVSTSSSTEVTEKGEATVIINNGGAQSVIVKGDSETAPTVTSAVFVPPAGVAQSTITLVGDQANSPLVSNETGSAIDVKIGKGMLLNLGLAEKSEETFGHMKDVTLEGDMNVINITSEFDRLITAATETNAVNIAIGNNQKRAALRLNELVLSKNSRIFIDPIWTGDATYDTIANASHLEVTNANESLIEGEIIAGRNAITVYGGTVAQADRDFNSHGLVWGENDVSSALYLGKTLTLKDESGAAQGAVVIDGSLTPTNVDSADIVTGGVTLADGSLLMINAATIGDKAIDGTLKVSDKSTVVVVNAAEGDITLANSVTGTIAPINDNQFLKSVFDSTKSAVVTTVDEPKLAGAVASMGIQSQAMRADRVFASTIADRTAQNIVTDGLSLWADVGGEHFEADDLDNGGQFKSNMFYGTFGGDIAVAPNTRIGAAIQYGSGDVKSDNYGLKNDVDAVGFALYGSYNVTNAAKIVADFAYTKTGNDITSSETLLKNDVDADVISFGVRGQHEFAVGAVKFVPSIGVRVSRISTDDFNVGTIKTEIDDQTLVQIPLSLAVSTDIEKNGWNIAPYAKVSFAPTFGDDEIKVHGYSQSVIDTMPVQGDFGLSATNGNVTIGATLSAGFGQDGAKNYGGKVGIRYAF